MGAARSRGRARGGALRALLVMLAGLALASLASSVFPLAAQAEEGEPLYLNLVWHQHQPLYYKDPATGLYSRPWVRVHATKDYYDMAATLAKYPQVHASFNLTPVLLMQLEDLGSGAKDLYQAYAEKDAARLSPAEKRFVLERFFDANYDNLIGRFPRYAELLAKRGGSSSAEIDRAMASFGAQDIRDLQVLFNLAWFDPSFLSEEPLESLAKKGSLFTEADKLGLFAKAREVIRSIIPLHKKLQDSGQIEILTTPYAHPILPLLYDTGLAKAADPAAKLPERFSWPKDALGHLAKSEAMYRGLFGRAPRGLWPGEGAVAQEIVGMVGRSGYSWMASGEAVLAKSLGIDSFSRDGSDTVQEADALYRPYLATDGDSRVAAVFRDQRLSDLIGFEYSKLSPEAAVKDFMSRLEAIRARLAAQAAKGAASARGPHLVSVILDGENAWEYYRNDGIEFLNGLYAALASSKTVRTATVSEYLARFAEPKALPRLASGCWFSPDFSTWIGEDEEAVAWNYLGRTREALAQYDYYKKKRANAQAIDRATDFMYLAEGSDWFWWFGSDQDSGQDSYFDFAFRSLLKSVYVSLGERPPAFLDAPIVSQATQQGSRAFSERRGFSPQVDGVESEGEWEGSGGYERGFGVQAAGAETLVTLSYGFSQDRVFLGVKAKKPFSSLPSGSRLRVYLGAASAPYSSSLSPEQRPLGFRAGLALDFDLKTLRASLLSPKASMEWGPSGFEALGAAKGDFAEFSLPLAAFGGLRGGDRLLIQALVAGPKADLSPLPEAGPLALPVPELTKLSTLLDFDDPEGDDRGPGTYLYPTDLAFERGCFDIRHLNLGFDDKELVLTLTLGVPVKNPWNSSLGLSLQTIDLYIDYDSGAATGSRDLLEGRNACLGDKDGWDLAVWVEGWSQKLLKSGPDGRPVEVSGYAPRLSVNAAKGQIRIAIPREALAMGAPASWGYACALLSQDGFPRQGVRRVRDVGASPSQWRFGGAAADEWHTRIIDLGLPASWPQTQASILSAYGPKAPSVIPLLRPGA
jgi:alpha-amylase/alpha-mannosidase (GH57 family)